MKFGISIIDTEIKIDRLSSAFRSETERMLQSARSNVQGFAAVNEELDALVGRQEALSERMTGLARADNDLNTKLDEAKQFFLKEIDEFRSVVLRTLGDSGSDRDDKKLQWQLTLANERAIESNKTILDRLTRSETQLIESVDELRRNQSEFQVHLSSLTRQALERPPVDPNRVLACEKVLETQISSLNGVERSLSDLWDKLSKVENDWQKSTADGFRRIQQELRSDKESLYAGVQDLRTVLSTEITARRRDQENNRVAHEALVARMEDGIAKIKDEARETARSVAQYIDGLETKRQVEEVVSSSSASVDTIALDKLGLKLQAAMTSTDARYQDIFEP